VGAVTLVLSLLGAYGATAVPAAADTLATSQIVAASSGLDGVACPTATTCEAVGTTQNNGLGLIVPVTNGVVGTAQSVTGTQSLSAIACPTATTCVALGTSSSGDVVVTIALGATDTFGTPTLASGVTQWYGIACPTATECEAVAHDGSGFAVVPIISGTPGSAQVAITGTYSSLDGIACPSATTCEAVGTFEINVSSFVGAIVPITNGVPGTVQQVSGIQNLNNIACPTASSCEAVGTNPGPAQGESTDAAVSINLGTTDGFGSVWPVQVVDGTPAVACATSTSCALVDTNVEINNGFITQGTETPLTDGFPGLTQPAPSSAGLVGVACPMATTCIGVGFQTVALGGGSTGSEGAVTPIGVTAPTAVSNLAFTHSNPGAGVNTLTYTFTFTATSSLAGGSSSIDLATAAGTVFPAWHGCGTYLITDTTSGASAGSCSQSTALADGTQAYGGGGERVVVTNPLSVAAGDTVTVVVNGVVNLVPVGSASVELSTSSDPIPVSTTFGVPLSGPTAPLSGTVTASSNPNPVPASGAPVQACATDGTFCVADATGTAVDGTYTIDVPIGETYVVTAFSPAGQNYAQESSAPVTIGSAGATGVDVELEPGPGMPGGVSVLSPNFGLETSGSVVVNWQQPFQVIFPASFFPANEVTTVETLVLSGINLNTGKAASVTVDAGGTTTVTSGPDAGQVVPIGLVVGSNGVTLTVPPLAPIHGPVQMEITSFSVPEPPTGVAVGGTVPVNFTNGATVQQVPIVATDNGVDHTVGAPTLSGPDASTFGVSSPVCAPQSTIVRLSASNPSPAATCDLGVTWTPPATLASPPKGYYYATLNVPVTNSSGQPATLPVPLEACDERVVPPTQCGGQNPNTNGTNGTTTGGTTPVGGIFVDPSGTVDTTTAGGTMVPVAGATVTLSLEDPSTSTFAVVPNGSDVMSPANRTNPQTTGADGSFGWDTLAGTYQVSAAATGCTQTSASTLTETVPPPATGLVLSLDCPNAPAPASTTLTASATPATVSPGESTTLTALVSGTNPTGTVTFTSGGTTLGTVPVDPSTATATLPTSGIPQGTDPVQAVYSGDSTNAPSTGSTSVTVSAPTAIATTTTVTATPSTVVQGALVGYQATATPASGSASPTGTVTFTTGTTTLCQAPLSGTSASCTSAAAPVGSDTVVATYSGDTNFAGSQATATEKVTTPPVNPPPVTPPPVTSPVPAANDGAFQGSAANSGDTTPFVAMAVDQATGGYWLVDTAGVVHAFNAPTLGSITEPLNAPIVAIIATVDGGGYTLVGADGGTFTFGDAEFHGSLANIPLNKPIVAALADPTTGGYTLIAADGGAFTFDTPFHGSLANLTLNRPIIGAAPTPDTNGYYMLGADGGLFIP
jgi:hypothetical protein